MKNDKSIMAAILLNLLVPGAGYMYMGRVFLGVIAFFLAVGAIIMTFGLAWFGWALIMTIDMFLLKKKLDKDAFATMKHCPQCAEHVQSAAQVCRYCNFKFNQSAEAA